MEIGSVGNLFTLPIQVSPPLTPVEDPCGSHWPSDWLLNRVEGTLLWDLGLVMEEVGGEETEVGGEQTEVGPDLASCCVEAGPGTMEDGNDDCDDGSESQNQVVEEQGERQGPATQVRLCS